MTDTRDAATVDTTTADAATLERTAVDGATATTTPSKPAKARDHWLDNVRFVLLAFVVIDHFSWPLLSGSRTMHVLFYWIHLFHMPAFVMVTGFFSRSLVVNDSRARGLVTRILVPYLIFQTLYQLGDPLLHHGQLARWAPLTPAWLMWFLMAMLVWRLMTPYLMRIRWIFPLSIHISLGAGAIAGVNHLLSMDRVLSFLPFFVLGLVIRREHLDVLRRVPARVAAVVVLVAAWPVSAVAATHLGVHWIFWDRSYASLHVSTLEGVAIRSALMVLAFATSAAVLALTPSGKNWMSVLGQGSLYGYLLHGFIAWGFKWTSIHTWFNSPLRYVLYRITACGLG